MKPRLTVAQFLARWLDYKESQVTAKTAERYRGICAHHLIPAFGSIPLAKLSPLQIQEHYCSALRSGRKDGRPAGLAPRSVRHHHGLLRQAMRTAVRWQLLKQNPADLVDPPRVPDREICAIDETGSAKLIQAARGTRLHVPVVLAVCAGLRRGEVLGLRWSDVDLDAGRLWVRQAVEQTKTHGIRFKLPKSRRSRRSIVLPSIAVEILQAYRAKQDGDGLVCCAPGGAVWAPAAFTSAYRDLLKRRKLDGPNFHALRHSHASQLLRAGVDIRAVSDRLGHANPAFTLATYAHMLPGQDDEAARKIDASLRKAMFER